MSIVEAFMVALTIRAGLPTRTHIAVVHADEVPAVLDVLGLPQSDQALCYSSVVRVIAERNAARPLQGLYASWMTGQVPDTPRGTLQAMVVARKVTRDDLVRALKDAVRLSGGVSGHTDLRARLSAKLTAGAVGPTRIGSALAYRDRWITAWSAMRTGLPGDSSYKADLELRVVDLAGDIEEQLKPTRVWGNEMYTTLRSKLAEDAKELVGGVQLDGSDLMGLAMDLTSRCHIWFSPEFNVDAALREAAKKVAL